jgi:HEAT repeat protein
MTSDTALLDDLATPYKARTAFWRLLERGRAVLPTIVSGLCDARADVRYHCCRLLDQLVTPEGLGALLDRLDDPDPRVRGAALHALTCDKCKEGVCLPTDGPMLDRAMAMMAADPNGHVRAMAIEAVARSAIDHPDALAAIVRTAASDPNPTVRKKAKWFVPGGPVFERARRAAEHRRPKGERHP